MAGKSPQDAYRLPPGGYRPSVSPWRQILPHFDWLTGECRATDVYGGLREFVALACDAPALADRFVFPSTVNMSVFCTPDPVGYGQNPMPPRFIVSPHGPAEVRLGYWPAGAESPAGEWNVPPGEAVAIIAVEFGLLGA